MLQAYQGSMNSLPPPPPPPSSSPLLPNVSNGIQNGQQAIFQQPVPVYLNAPNYYSNVYYGSSLVTNNSVGPHFQNPPPSNSRQMLQPQINVSLDSSAASGPMVPNHSSEFWAANGFSPSFNNLNPAEGYAVRAYAVEHNMPADQQGSNPTSNQPRFYQQHFY
jgi:hypothetical protein